MNPPTKVELHSAEARVYYANWWTTLNHRSRCNFQQKTL